MKKTIKVLLCTVSIPLYVIGMEKDTFEKNNVPNQSLTVPSRQRSSSFTDSRELTFSQNNLLSLYSIQEKRKQDEDREREKKQQEKLQLQKLLNRDKCIEDKTKELIKLANQKNSKDFAKKVVSFDPQKDLDSISKDILQQSSLNQNDQIIFLKETKKWIERRNPHKTITYQDLVSAVKSRDVEEFVWSFNVYERTNKNCNQTANELMLMILSDPNLPPSDQAFKVFYGEVLKRLKQVDPEMKFEGQDGVYTLARKKGTVVLGTLKKVSQERKKNEKDSSEFGMKVQKLSRRQSDCNPLVQSSENSTNNQLPPEDKKKAGFWSSIQKLVLKKKEEKNTQESAKNSTIEYSTLEIDQENLKQLPQATHNSLTSEQESEQQKHLADLLNGSKLD